MVARGIGLITLENLQLMFILTDLDLQLIIPIRCEKPRHHRKALRHSFFAFAFGPYEAVNDSAIANSFY